MTEQITDEHVQIQKQLAELSFIESFNIIASYIYDNARQKGFWKNPDAKFLEGMVDELTDRIPDNARSNLSTLALKISLRNNGEMLALIHSEISEALEGLRNGNPPSDKIPEFSAAEEELADAIIRIMDMAHSRNWHIAEAVVAKMAYNATRPYRHGGKEF